MVCKPTPAICAQTPRSLGILHWPLPLFPHARTGPLGITCALVIQVALNAKATATKHAARFKFRLHHEAQRTTREVIVFMIALSPKSELCERSEPKKAVIYFTTACRGNPRGTPRTIHTQSMSQTSDFAIKIQFFGDFQSSLIISREMQPVNHQHSNCAFVCAYTTISALHMARKFVWQAKFCAHCTSATSPPTPLHSQTQQ